MTIKKYIHSIITLSFSYSLLWHGYNLHYMPAWHIFCTVADSLCYMFMTQYIKQLHDKTTVWLQLDMTWTYYRHHIGKRNREHIYISVLLQCNYTCLSRTHTHTHMHVLTKNKKMKKVGWWRNVVFAFFLYRHDPGLIDFDRGKTRLIQSLLAIFGSVPNAPPPPPTPNWNASTKDAHFKLHDSRLSADTCQRAFQLGIVPSGMHVRWSKTAHKGYQPTARRTFNQSWRVWNQSNKNATHWGEGNSFFEVIKPKRKLIIIKTIINNPPPQTNPKI